MSHPEAWTTEQKARFLESALAAILDASDPVMPFRAFARPGDCQNWCDVVGKAHETLIQARAATKEEMERVTNKILPTPKAKKKKEKAA